MEARLSAALATAEDAQRANLQASAARELSTMAIVGVRTGVMAPTPGEGATRDEDGADEAGEVATAVVQTNPDETNVWPTASEEAAFLSEARGRGEKIMPIVPEVVEEAEESAKPLPKLDELVNRIPAETRELLDDLFRAKFVAVRRVKKKDLKS